MLRCMRNSLFAKVALPFCFPTGPENFLCIFFPSNRAEIQFNNRLLEAFLGSAVVCPFGDTALFKSSQNFALSFHTKNSRECLKSDFFFFLVLEPLVFKIKLSVKIYIMACGILYLFHFITSSCRYRSDSGQG